MHSLIATRINKDTRIRELKQFLPPTPTQDQQGPGAHTQEPAPRYFSQFDMAMVQTAFCGTLTLKAATLGVALDSHLEDYLHFWRG
jgi:hypothetical protein